MDNKKSAEQPQKHALGDEPKGIKSSPAPDAGWDFEFEQSTQTFEDALFADEQALDQALQKVIRQSDEQILTTTTPTNNDATPVTDEPVVKAQIDFSICLTAGAKNNIFSSSNNISPADGTQLNVLDGGVNGSPAAVAIDTIEYPKHKQQYEQRHLNQGSHSQLQHRNETDNSKNPIIRAIKKQMITIKAHADKYFGRDLPRRDFALEFQFPALKPKKEFDGIVSTYDIRRLFSYKGTSLASILKKADIDLGNLVKCKISQSYRLNVLETYSPLLVEKINSLIATIERKPSVVAESKRQRITLHAQNVLKHLINGYRHIYATAYELPNYRYAPKRLRINACAFRLLDLLCLEQHLATALQRALPSGSAKVFNTLYSALSRYESAMLDQEYESLTFTANVCAKQLFLRYQLVQCFDMMSLSPTQHKIVYAYLQHHLGTIPVKFSLELSSISSSWLKVSHDSHGAPVVTKSLPEDNCPAILIWVNQLFNQIKKDYAHSLNLMGSINPVHDSPALAPFKVQDVLTVLSVLNVCITHIEQHTRRADYSLYQPADVKVYAPFSAVVAYLNYQYKLQCVSKLTKGDPVKSVAGKPKAGKSEWLCAMEDDQTLYLQTQESKAELVLNVGSILLLVSNKDDIEQLQLTQIIRMERIQQGKINLVASKIANQVAAVTLLETGSKPAPGIIAVHADIPCLITTHALSAWTGKAIDILLPDDSTSTICVDALMSISHQVQILKQA